MLYIPWKKESDILGNFHTYEDAFNTKRPEIIQKLAIYEPMSSILESALEEFEKDTFDELCVAPSAQHDNNDDANVDKTTAHELAFHEPDNASGQHLVDIGPLLGIVPVHIDDDNIELIPDIMTDNEYYDLLCKLNRKQQEFHMHIMQQSQQNINQVLCALHGGAGTGKSTVIHAIHQGLYRLLKKSAQDHSIQHILLVAPTGKAASNIHGTTIHKAFFIPANQKLEHKPLSWDHLNTARNKFYGIRWILIDDVPHFFPTKDSIIAYNNTILEQSPGESITVIAIDSPPTDITCSMQEQILIAARKKDVNSTGNLPHQLTIKIGLLYDLTANVAVDDGLVNGAECYVRGIEDDPSNVNFPKYIWIEFTDIKIGQKLRRVSNHQYSSKIPKTWTPLSSVRSFIVKRDQRVTRRQFPLQLGAAHTIHKAQSSTFGQIVVDMFTLKNPPRRFWEHTHYVAWSRCTSLDGLFIVNINEEYICQSEQVRRYLSEDKKELELCYTPSYQVEDSIKIMYHNVCSISRKQGVIMNNQHVLGCDISILAETLAEE